MGMEVVLFSIRGGLWGIHRGDLLMPPFIRPCPNSIRLGNLNKVD